MTGSALHAPIEKTHEVMRATSRGRVLATLVAVLAIALVAAFQFYAFPYFRTVVSNTSAPPSAEAIRIVKTVFFGIAVLGMLSSAVLISHARKILRFRQYPPPGAWLWRDTRIVRDASAVRYARLHIAVGIITCIACVGLATFITLTLDRLGTQYKARPGVMIMQQKTFRAP